MNEFVSAKRRGRFFLLYEVLFLFGLLSAGLIGYFLVPIYGWQAMFVVGLAPAILTIPMRWFMVESPRWLLTVGRAQQASDIVARMENGLIRRGTTLEPPSIAIHPLDKTRSDIRELFRGNLLSTHDPARRVMGLLIHDRQWFDHLVADPVPPRSVRHQRSLDRTGGLNKGEFLAHRNVHRSEDETANPTIEGPG